jgi:7,8-dihydro-6-hydroxymethylpterin dimethyltransferase
MELIKQENLGICPKCLQVAPVEHKISNGKVYLEKQCKKCGDSASLVSSNATRYQEKRDLLGYTVNPDFCGLNCDSCNHGKPPTLVFLDVTNGCNMNCPICLANIPAMGFHFNPPMEYFEKIFQKLTLMNPRPKIQLFGGEPTVRNDLIEIIERASFYGLHARVVTNGVRLADAEYCQKLLATGTQLMFAFDGRNPEIYNKIRRTPRAYENKLQALENIRKYHKYKITIMCCAGLGVNEKDMADLIRMCHEGQDYIAALDLIPLTETWGPESVEAEDTTIEDVERMIIDALPGTEFISSGVLYRLPTLLATFDLGRITFGGAHPNCESVTVLISDGQAYYPLSRYLKISLPEMVRIAIEADRLLEKKLERSLIARWFGKRGRQWAAMPTVLGLLGRTIRFKEIFGRRMALKVTLVLWGLLRGVKLKDLLRRHTQCHNILRVMVLPFEETANLESERMKECPASFAYEHPLSREIRFMPVCAWPTFKNQILRETARHYAPPSP